LTGTAIDLNRDTGDTGGSTGTESLGGDTVDTDVIKVVDIGFISSTLNTSDAHLSFDFQNVDSDGDYTSGQTLDVYIEGNHLFEGTTTHDSIYGSSADDTIHGLAGDDVMYGNDGADHLHGGAGNDTMYGGDGIDTFVYDSSDLDTGHDAIMDFHYGAGGEELDLSSLFGGADPHDLVTDGHLLIETTADPSILNVTIDADGTAGGDDFVTVELHLDTTPVGGEDVVDTILNNNIKTEMP
jgi:Ca2+-binding RTX toxin-like protein